jgi:hemoglobin
MSRLLRSSFASSLLALTLLFGCKTESDGEGDVDDEGGDGTLYERLGGEQGIEAVVTAAVVDRIAADPRINAYFLNSSVEVGFVINCLTIQLGSLTGGPQEYPNADCRDMQTSHEGLGISDEDFNDLAGHFEDELTARGVAAADIQTIMDALGGMHDDIVEDAPGTATMYQRVGRYPAIQTVMTGFVDLVLADPTLMAFFADTDRVRLEACLSRQVCGIDGPCEYGFEVPGLQPMEFGAGACRSMMDSHGMLTITIEDFQALVGHLGTAMTDAGISMEDQGVILGALGPLCTEIVSDPTSCP